MGGIWSIDCETTGPDRHHGARPFLVTMAEVGGDQLYWEWDVDPETREVAIPDGDAEEIRDAISDADLLIGQNIKFDYLMLQSTRMGIIAGWDWSKVRDTLIAGHLLASNHPHNLTDMAVEYLGVNIEPYEKSLKDCCDKARRHCRTNLPSWMIAKEGLPCMPSAGETVWKFDTWLPRTLIRFILEHGGEIPPEWNQFSIILSEYANADSAVTVALHIIQEKILRRRNLWRMYEERLKLIPIIAGMEMRGVTVNSVRLADQMTEYQTESDRCEAVCKNIAEEYEHVVKCGCLKPVKGIHPNGPKATCKDCIGSGSHPFTLDLPKGASPNDSLRTFMFDVLGLEVIQGKKAKTERGSLDKEVMDHYRVTLPSNSVEALFVRSLMNKRKRDTALAFIKGYERYWQPWDGDTDEDEWYVLHPSLNMTGTDTLRFSCNNPNAQQISKQENFNLRYSFGPPPGWEWWSLDAKNIEARLPAYESGEQDLIELYENSNEPPYYGSFHLLSFHTVYSDIWEKELGRVCNEKCCGGRIVDVTTIGPHCKKKFASTWYQYCKNGDFAVQYSAVNRVGGTADRAFHRPGCHSLLMNRLSKLDNLNNKWVRFAEQHGYVETIPDRDVDPERGYPLLCTRTENGRILPTVPLNYHIQGSACWWMCMAMIRCEEILSQWRREGFMAYMEMQIHDEIVFALPKSKRHPKDGERGSNLGRAKILQRAMERGGDGFGIPCPVSIEYNEVTWAEGVTF